MLCAEPKVAYVQLNTREAKNIVKLELTLTYMEKLTAIAARDWVSADTRRGRREASRRE